MLKIEGDLLCPIYISGVLSEIQPASLASKLSEPKSLTGRPAYTNAQLLPSILRVLRSGCRWRDLNFLNIQVQLAMEKTSILERRKNISDTHGNIEPMCFPINKALPGSEN